MSNRISRTLMLAFFSLGYLSGCDAGTPLIKDAPDSGMQVGNDARENSAADAPAVFGEGDRDTAESPMKPQSDAAQAEARPVADPPMPRVIFMYTGHGTVARDWRPTGSDFQLGPILKPLERWKSKLLVLEGVSNVVDPSRTEPEKFFGFTHYGAAASLFTSARGSLKGGSPTDITSYYLGGGPSIEQAIAKAQVPTQFPLVLGIRSARLGGGDTVSYLEKDKPNQAEDDPNKAHLAVFGSALPKPIDVTNPASFVDTGLAQIDSIVEAIARKKTNVAMLVWGNTGVPFAFDSLIPGFPKDTLGEFHSSSADSAARITQIGTAFAQSLAYMVGKLEATPDGAGNLLDSTVVVWVSESGDTVSDVHIGRNIPVVIVGSSNNRLRVGRYLKVTNRTQGDLWLTLGSLFGLKSFGDPAIARGPILEMLNP